MRKLYVFCLCLCRMFSPMNKHLFGWATRGFAMTLEVLLIEQSEKEQRYRSKCLEISAVWTKMGLRPFDEKSRRNPKLYKPLKSTNTLTNKAYYATWIQIHVLWFRGNASIQILHLPHKCQSNLMFQLFLQLQTESTVLLYLHLFTYHNYFPHLFHFNLCYELDLSYFGTVTVWLVLSMCMVLSKTVIILLKGINKSSKVFMAWKKTAFFFS